MATFRSDDCAAYSAYSFFIVSDASEIPMRRRDSFMSRLPQVRPKEMIAALQRAGFVVVRTKGSHHFMVHRDDPTRWTTVAMHGNDLSARDVHDILKQAKIPRDEFQKLL